MLSYRVERSGNWWSHYTPRQTIASWSMPQGLFVQLEVIFLKSYKTVDEQIEILKSRKMSFPNEKLAHIVLQHEGYYSIINGYKTPFLDSTDIEDTYKAGVTFNEIIALSSFDRKLREFLLPELLRIEHSVKTHIVNSFSRYHGHDHTSYLRPDSFNSNGFKNFKRVNTLIFELLKLIDKQGRTHGAIKHYLDKYGTIPLWVLAKVMTFGKLNSFYGCMLQKDKEEVAQSFHLKSETFKTLIDFIAIFRNKCAHDERIYCHIKDQKKPQPIPNLSVHESLNIPRNEKGYKYGTQDVLALLIAMKYFLQGDRYRKLIKHIDYALNIKLAKRLHSISVDDIKKVCS